MTNKNARIIIPFAVVVWLLSITVFSGGVSPVIEGAFVLAFLIAVPVLVFYLMAEMGWSSLAKRFRAQRKFDRPWRPCPTAQMSHVSVDDPAYGRNKFRLVGGTLRIGTDAEALHLSMLFSKLPLLGRFFPDIAIPLSSVGSARTYEAPGWFTPTSEPGALLQAGYDPNYTGRFVEIVAGEPAVYLQLPASFLGEAMARLPLRSDA